MFFSGLRISEVTALRWDDIDGLMLNIRRMYRWSTKEIIPHTKGRAGYRNVPIIPEAADILELAAGRQQAKGVNTCYIFSMTKDPPPYKQICKAYYRYCRLMGIDAKSSHKARKTYISTLVDAGVNINTIRQLAGHTDEKTTLHNYTFDRMKNEEKIGQIAAALAKNDPQKIKK